MSLLNLASTSHVLLFWEAPELLAVQRMTP